MPVQHQWASVAAWQDEAHVIENRRQYRQKFADFYAIVHPVLPLSMPKQDFIFGLKCLKALLTKPLLNFCMKKPILPCWQADI
jgi:hypothetical protein